jgi:hypothetical protein
MKSINGYEYAEEDKEFQQEVYLQIDASNLNMNKFREDRKDDRTKQAGQQSNRPTFQRQRAVRF